MTVVIIWSDQNSINDYIKPVIILEVERGRHFNIPKEVRLCKLCGTNYKRQEIECGFHFLLQCPFYDSLRANSTSIVFDKTLFKFKNLMSHTDTNWLRHLVFFQ